MSSSQLIAFLAMVVTLLLHGNNNIVVEAQLRANFYSASCPRLNSIVRTAVSKEVEMEPRMGASLLRLFYLDCFVRGCDGSILLDDTSSLTGEQSAIPNHNSARGFNVIDNIKSMVERECPEVVSCADILAIAAKNSVELLGGPSWQLRFGRRDSRIAIQGEVLSNIPAPFMSVTQLTSIFNAKGFTTRDLVALSGAHTIGQSKCINFRERIYNYTNIDPTFATELRKNCPSDSGDENLAPLDSLTPFTFDNSYFKNLVANKGLLHSDQELLKDRSTNDWVRLYSVSPRLFSAHFAEAMSKMSGLINPLAGSDGEIRKRCGMIN